MSLHPSVNGGVGVGVGHRLAGVAHVQEGLQIVLPQPFGDQLILFVFWNFHKISQSQISILANVVLGVILVLDFAFW